MFSHIYLESGVTKVVFDVFVNIAAEKMLTDFTHLLCQIHKFYPKKIHKLALFV